ncbi:MAG: enolase [Nitrosopumilus sp. H8]|nr:MAG: enolase [Nitrosopumilus sp. H13]RNJ78674.1 MAG: enolase [Nitrosopumilus sp. H8]
MTGISSVRGRIVYNSRGSKTLEIDVVSEGGFAGRVCAPSGASVGRHEAVAFAPGGPAESLEILKRNAQRFVGLDSSDLRGIHSAIKEIDPSPGYSKIGGAVAFALTIASTESASRAAGRQLFEMISQRDSFYMPYPLGNILGGGAHAGPGTPDIQEILVCATGSKTIQDAADTNLAIHRELGRILSERDPGFTRGRSDEGGWAPGLDNEAALEVSARACESLGYTLGKEVSLGADFAASTQWDEKRQKYIYDRAGFENTPGEQIDFAAEIISRYKLAYVEDAVHEEAFDGMAELTLRFPKVMITGDDLTVTNRDILARAAESKSCNAAILKVNQAGSLHDALEFASLADSKGIKLVTSHRSGESVDSHIAHIGIATGSRMLKAGIVGGERTAKINELLRLAGHDLICGMAEV